MWGRTSWPAPLPASHSPPCSDWSTQKVDIEANCRQSRTRSWWRSRREHVPVDCVRLCLRRVLDVGLIQQLLDTQQDLKRPSGVLQSDRRWRKRPALINRVFHYFSPSWNAKFERAAPLGMSDFFLTCLMVMAGLQSLSSSKMDKHTVPDG